MKVRATIAVAVVGIVLFAYARPLTITHAAAHVLLLRAGMHAHYAEVQGHRIRYFVGGDGPPLLLLHGLGSSSEDWALVAHELTRRHRLYAPDLLGWGGSDKPRGGDYSIAAQTELVRGFMDAVHLGRADAGGVSMGGWIALRLAALYPERVQRLVLIDSIGLDFPTSLNESSFAPHTIAEARHLLWLQSDKFGKLPDFVVEDFLRHVRRDEWLLRASSRSMLSRRDVMDGKLQRVTMPVLLVWGANDRLAPPSLVARFHAQLPQSRVVMLPGCGHLAVVECRAQAIPAIEQFLSEPQALRPRSRETTGSASGGPARPAALIEARAVARRAPKASGVRWPKASSAAGRAGPPEAPSSFPGVWAECVRVA